MPPQRACGAESQVGYRAANGPLRAHGNPIGRVFCDVGAYVSCRGYAGIPQGHGSNREAGWHRGNVHFRP
ncbi:MAG: hypothetical protein E7465_01855 [Ruminococcaceae bacterium]|nr:hypothetical protein [Oscillospiraceae bacterium]